MVCQIRIYEFYADICSEFQIQQVTQVWSDSQSNIDLDYATSWDYRISVIPGLSNWADFVIQF